MTKDQEKTVDQLTNSVDNLTFAVEELTQALNQRDDFNNWTTADSLASIANSFYKYTAILNKQNNTK